MKKIIGLDLGSRTCGIALSDELGLLAHGLETFRFPPEQYDKVLTRVISLIDEYQIETVVLGLPKHMNGDVGVRAEISFEFKKKLIAARPGVNVVLEDERLTTVIAENELIFADLSRKKRKKVIDKMAAVTILQGYLDRIRG